MKDVNRTPASWALMILFLVTGAQPVEAAVQVVDLRDEHDMTIDGAYRYDHAGTSVGSAGDVNGDGVGDVIVGTSDNAGRRNFGRAYVLFGPLGNEVDLRHLGDDGFRIKASGSGDFTGRAVAGAGDVNGDGLDDVIVGAPWADFRARINSGSAYVVFGKADTVAVHLDDLDAGGYRIDGAGDHHYAGSAVSGIGDVNRDGLSDVVLGAPLASENGRDYSGSAYVVFGQAASDVIDLRNLGDTGYRIDGSAPESTTGWSVSGAGDVNGDNKNDLVVGAPATYFDKRGASYVVFGGGPSADIDLASLGARGFKIAGGAAEDNFGRAVSGGGDVNGDGLDDVLIGAPTKSASGREDSGAAFLVFGRSETTKVRVRALESDGYRIKGARRFERAGAAVSIADDINGDGRDETVVGAPFASYNGRIESGSAYVVRGKRSNSSLDLRTLHKGYRVDGEARNDLFGWSVSGLPDIGGDRLGDFIGGATEATQRDRPSSGAAYIVQAP